MAFKNSLIKCLIWLGFLFVNSAITTGLAYAGVRLGAIPPCCFSPSPATPRVPAAKHMTGNMRLCQAPLTPEKSQSLLLRQTVLLQKNRQSGKKTGKKSKWAKLSSSKTPRACSRSSLSRRTNRAASRRNRSFLPSRYWWSCLLHPAACSGIICNACRKVCRRQTDPS